MKTFCFNLSIMFTLCLGMQAQINKTWIPSNAPYQIGGWGMGLAQMDNELLLSGSGAWGSSGSQVYWRKVIATIDINNLDTITVKCIESDSAGLLTFQGSIIKISDSIWGICNLYERIYDTSLNGNLDVVQNIQMRIFNKNLDQLNIKQYEGLNLAIPYCTNKIGEKLLITGVSSLVKASTSRQAYILCLNDTGAILWQTYLGENNKEDIAFSSALTADGGYLISARTDLTRYPIIGNDDSIDANNSIYKFDSNGTLQWKKVMWKNSYSYGTRIQESKTGAYYYGNFRDTTAALKSKTIAVISKIDANADIIWEHKFENFIPGRSSIWDFRVLNNYDILLYGTVVGGGFNQDNGWLCRIDSNGSVLWQHTYKSYSASTFGYLCDAVELTNGDLVITGSASDSVSGGKQAIWLLRTDAQGCLLQGCNPLGTVQLEPIQATQLVAYPNPTNSNIILQSNNGSLLQGAVQVLNAQGQMVYSVLQKTAIAKINIPLAKQPSGVYFVRYVSAINNTVSTLQVVKE
jgi:hypothetical protein